MRLQAIWKLQRMNEAVINIIKEGAQFAPLFIINMADSDSLNNRQNYSADQ